MANKIYRGYDIKDDLGTSEMSVKVYKDGIYIWAGRSETAAMEFIDRSKRELAQAKKG